MTSVNPLVVYSLATTRLTNPSSFAACSVMGPIHANHGFFGRFIGSSPCCLAMATKFCTVDGLVRVTHPHRIATRPVLQRLDRQARFYILRSHAACPLL